ncbi:MAG: hypothetical protein U9Q90_01785 [Campylobacterota bacterium]|nr:hypothetical protein [Campylobacterota bacterium]
MGLLRKEVTIPDDIIQEDEVINAMFYGENIHLPGDQLENYFDERRIGNR